MPLAEGKNIHFSPVDNKPLCSYSNKLCRQRRLNGYGFCIRHILEDKSAPFKQCDYVTRNNSQKCLNAIPTNQERGYCHSHMQVAGIIPKTERKVKPPANAKSNTSGGIEKVSNGIDVISESSGNLKSSKTNPNGLKPVKTNPKSKGKLNNSCSIVVENSTFSNTINASSIISTSTRPLNVDSSRSSSGFSSIPIPNIIIPDESTGKKKAKGNGKKVSTVQQKVSPSEKPPPKPKKSKKNPPKSKTGDEVWKTVADRPHSSTSSAFEQLKTLKILEKLPLRSNGEYSHLKNHVDIDSTEIRLSPFLRNFSISESSSGGVTKIESGVVDPCGTNIVESRTDYLRRIRSQFKSQYETLRAVVKRNVMSEERVNEALRESLLACVVIDPSRCAHILVNGEDDVDQHQKGTSSKKGSKNPNGLVNGKRKEKMSQGNQTQNSISNDRTNTTDSAVTEPSTKQKKTKSGKNGKKLITLDTIDLNPVQIKIEQPEIEFLGPWVNGTIKTMDTYMSDGKKGKSKAKSSGKSQANSKSGENKVKTPRTQRISGGSLDSKAVIGSGGAVNSISTSNIIVPPPAKKWKKEPIVSRKSNTFSGELHQQHLSTTAITGTTQLLQQMPHLIDKRLYADASFGGKKRRMDLSESASTILSNGHHRHHPLLDPNLTLNATAAFHTAYSPSDFSGVAQLENVLNSVSSSDTATTPDGVITDASFDSPFDHSTSSHPDCDFTDDVDDLEKSFELHIDDEIAHQASQLIEENGFTEDDFSELFPENRLSDHKLGNDLGMDFPTSTFETADLDYAIFSNILSNFRPPGSNESISVTQNF